MGVLITSQSQLEKENEEARTVISEDEVFDLVNKLRNFGAKDILAVPIEKNNVWFVIIFKLKNMI